MNRTIRFSTRKLLLFFALSDFVLPAIVLCLVSLFFSNGGWGAPAFWLATIIGFCLLVGMSLARGYSRYSERTLAKKLQLVFQVWAYIVLCMLVLAFFLPETDAFAPSVMLLWVLITPFALVLFRFAILHAYQKRNHSPTKILFLSDYAFTEFEESRLHAKNYEWRFLSNTNDMDTFITEYKPDYVVLPEQNNCGKNSLQSQHVILKELSRLHAHSISAGPEVVKFEQFMEELLRKCFVNYNTTQLIYLEQISAYSQRALVLKRFVDIASAFILLSITWPVMLYSAWRIRKESAGPIIYSQKRVGRLGKEFTLYKFRSMHLNSDFDPYTRQEDVRIFAFGAVMRKTRIDELPQLWNVLKGDMHLFGPRSEWNILVSEYEKDIPFYHERHLVAPGISGWAQVMYPYGASVEDARQKLMYDLYYIKNWSIWLEIETLLRTVGVVLGKKGI